MGVLWRVAIDYQSTHETTVTLVVSGDVVLISGSSGDTVVAHHRIGHHQDLPHIAGVCERLGVTIHGCIKDYLTGQLSSRTEVPARVGRSVL